METSTGDCTARTLCPPIVCLVCGVDAVLLWIIVEPHATITWNRVVHILSALLKGMSFEWSGTVAGVSCTNNIVPFYVIVVCVS